MGKILVTGATGNIGEAVVKELLSREAEVKAAVRNTEAGRSHFGGDLQHLAFATFDFMDPSTFPDALQDVDRVFLVRPPQLADPKRDMEPFITYAKAHGIEHIVFISLMGVENNPIAPHKKIEDLIVQYGIPYTFLRPGFFMQNLNTNHRDDIRLRSEIFLPVGKAKTSFIDTRDIGAAAAVCLTEEGHLGKAYTLTGAKALDYGEAARILTDVLKRPIVYKSPGFLRFRKTQIQRGVKKEFANVMTMLYLLTRLGTARKVTDDLKQLLGREPISFRQYAEDYKNQWM